MKLYPHIAITVPDLEEAEAYYRDLFGMEVITREASTPEGDAQLPHDKGWDDARAAGIDLTMLALRRDQFVLALFDESVAADRGLDVPRRPLFVGLRMSAEEISALRARVGEAWEDDNEGFRDRYGIFWQPDIGGTEFLGNGDARGRWLEV